MQSEAGQPQTTPPTSNPPPRRPEVSTPPVHPSGVTKKSVEDNLKVSGNESPLDFVTRNLGENGGAEIDPQAVADAISNERIKPNGPPTPSTPSEMGQVTLDRILNAKPAQKPPPKKETSDAPPEPKSLFDLNGEAPPEEPSPEEAPSEEEETLPEETEEASKAESIKALRTLVGEGKKKYKALETEKAALQKKIEAYESGAEVPEVLKTLKQRVEELEPLEKIHRLKSSRAYNEKLVKPIKNLETKLVALGEQENIPEEVMRELPKLKGSARNDFLSEHFNTAGIIDAKAILEPLDKLNEELKAAEEEPTKALSALETKSSAEYEARKEARKAKFASKAKSTWVESLTKLRKEGKAEMLIPRDGDDEHNKKFVFPLQAKAATDFGKFVDAFEELGMEDLPDQIAGPIANMVILAHSAATANAALKLMTEKYEELLSSTKRINPLFRPSIGGGAGSGEAPTQKAPASPMEAGEVLINSILQSKGR